LSWTLSGAVRQRIFLSALFRRHFWAPEGIRPRFPAFPDSDLMVQQRQFLQQYTPIRSCHVVPSDVPRRNPDTVAFDQRQPMTTSSSLPSPALLRRQRFPSKGPLLLASRKLCDNVPSGFWGLCHLTSAETDSFFLCPFLHFQAVDHFLECGVFDSQPTHSLKQHLFAIRLSQPVSLAAPPCY